MHNAIDAFAGYLANHRSPRTAATYAATLTSFSQFTSAHGRTWPPSSRIEVEAFLSRSRRDGGRRSAASRNQELAALRAFFAFAQRDGHATSNPTEGIPFAREAARDPAVLSLAELKRVFVAAAEAPPARRSRDVAIIAVLAQAGLRVHELVALDDAQLDAASATLIAVRGKGGTVHDVPLNPPTLALLDAWRRDRRALASSGERALFVSASGSRVSARSVQRLVERLRTAIGTAKHMTPHTLRHTTATLALTLGADLSTVADLLRHTDLNTTRRYLHLVDERRREAVRRLGAAIPAELMPAPIAASDDEQDPLDVQYGLADAA